MALVQAAEEATKADWLEAWATVVAAVGTVGAFAWQGLALRQERLTRRAEVARLQADQREAQDAQARTVVVHRAYATKMWHNKRTDGPDDPRLIGDYRVTLGNYGEFPITNVVSTLTYIPRRWVVELDEDRVPWPKAVMLGEEILQWDLSRLLLPWPEDLGEDDNGEHLFACEVHFTDVHGIRWSVRPGLGQQPLRVFAYED
jgi:hypothetical protein